MKILLCNDDGVHAHGLHVLHHYLKKLGKVWVVAPLEEKSTTGHSLTIHKPLRIIEFGENRFGVNGSPADCVYLGIREVLKGKPDIVVSGINRGANLGQDVYYSGTVSAAREACMLGIPAVAVSSAVNFLRPPREDKINYATAAQMTCDLIKKGIAKGLPYHTLINLNVPDLPLKKIKGVRVAHQGFRFYSGSVIKRRDHRGKDYFWVGGQYLGFKNDDASDCHVVDEGFLAVTPVKLDCTDREFSSKMKLRWDRGK